MIKIVRFPQHLGRDDYVPRKQSLMSYLLSINDECVWQHTSEIGAISLMAVETVDWSFSTEDGYWIVQTKDPIHETYIALKFSQGE